MNNDKSTIFALSSHPGKSAIALIRITGKNSHKIVSSISTNMPLNPNLSTYNEIIFDNEVIDQTITTYFKSPKSFTGEDMVEISIHGGGATIKSIISILSNQKNTRIAKPGEFTRRAFENNKLDLTQVEAISDIVNAETEMQRKQAMGHLSGNFFKETQEIFEGLKKILANVEATIDFTEEDLPENLQNNIKEQIENNIIRIKEILDNSSVGISIRDGFLVTIIGKPNTGKSSFINSISGRDIAIVSDIPGTTRDLIESFVDIDGYPIKFVDTAGIRDSLDSIEKIGIEKALLSSNESSLCIVFIEKKEDILDFKNIENAIFVKSKQDILKSIENIPGVINISSNTKYGISDLLSIIKEKISNKTPQEKMIISRERHKKCLKDTLLHLKNTRNSKSIDIFAEDIRLSIKSLSNLFGSVDIEDILDIVFSDFCIGK